MSSRRKELKAKKTEEEEEEEEVDELLREAQDDMLLRLSVDSHISHLSDLDRRFQALKLNTKPPPTQQLRRSVDDVDPELKAVLGDDLSARFAALKASSSSTIAPTYDVDVDDDEDDPVEKLMRWVKDAARLDPSPPSNDEQ